MPESLGARLRRRREEKRIALSTIAERTKIKSALLEALERDDVSQWPAGIYRRAFIRSYAGAIGLDPDTVVREFLELYPDPEAAVAEVPPPTGLRGVVQALGSLARLGGRTPAAEAPTPSGTLNLHGTISPQHPASTPDRAPAELLDAPQVPERADDPSIGAVSDPALEPDSDALINAVEENVDPITSLPVRVEPERPSFEPDLMAVARICTGFARVERANDLSPLLSQAAAALGASGMIVWVWDSMLEGLRPVLAHGYPEKVLVQLPTVGRDEDNATAAAFRSEEPCAIPGAQETNGALVVPLLTATGASGVLAIELSDGREQLEPVHAVARIFAAMLAPLVAGARVSTPAPVEETIVPPASFRARIARP
jgi:transcriptional regulator with XRE-family HTH domain